ncbi:MAG: MOSC domain-containing protein [Gammaproteobacteria bacterium]
MQSLDEAQLVQGRGILGDRYCSEASTFSGKSKDSPGHEVTLIESEQIDRFNQITSHSLDYGATRRNLVTQGVNLNDLVGREFRVGEVMLQGVRLCEPCSYLANLVAKEVLPQLVHRAGLRARIISGGVVRPGDRLATDGTRDSDD